MGKRKIRFRYPQTNCKLLEIIVDELLENNNYDYNFGYNHNGTVLIRKEKNKNDIKWGNITA